MASFISLEMFSRLSPGKQFSEYKLMKKASY